MKTNIMILNCLCYEKDGKVSTRLGFILSDKDSQSFNEKFKGSSELSNYYDGKSVFDKITKELLFKPLVAHLKTIPSFKNPMASRQIVESIEVNGALISLLQSE